MNYFVEIIASFATFAAAAIFTFLIDDPKKLLNYNYGFLFSIIAFIDSIMFILLRKRLDNESKLNERAVNDLRREISNINNVLQEYLPESYDLFKYSNSGAWRHHKLNDALEYDIQRINSLGKGDYFYSTYLNEFGRIQKELQDPLFNGYVKAMIDACDRGVDVQRLIVVQGYSGFDEASREHFDCLKKQGY